MSAVLSAPTITPAEFLEMGDRAQGFELVDGQLKGKPMSTESCRVGGRVYRRVGDFAEKHRLGWDLPPETAFRCFADDPGRVRKPDGAFISFNTLPETDYEPDGFCTTVPDLIWEVVSPNDLANELDEKIDEWLAAGVKVTWVFHPQNRTVHILRADGTSALLRERDTLSEPSLLPGFSASVGELFGRPTRTPA
jgi:Uma2 family endonuclease